MLKLIQYNTLQSRNKLILVLYSIFVVVVTNFHSSSLSLSLSYTSIASHSFNGTGKSFLNTHGNCALASFSLFQFFWGLQRICWTTNFVRFFWEKKNENCNESISSIGKNKNLCLFCRSTVERNAKLRWQKCTFWPSFQVIIILCGRKIPTE